MSNHLTTPLTWDEHVYSHVMQPNDNTSDQEKIDFLTRNMEPEFARVYGNHLPSAKIDFFYNKNSAHKAIDLITDAYGDIIQAWIDNPQRRKGDKLQITSNGDILETPRGRPPRTYTTDRIDPQKVRDAKIGMAITLNQKNNATCPKMKHLSQIRIVFKIDNTYEHVTRDNPKGAFILSLHPNDDKIEPYDYSPDGNITTLSPHNTEILTSAYNNVSYVRNGGVTLTDRYNELLMRTKLTYGEELDIRHTRQYNQIIAINNVPCYAISPEGISHTNSKGEIIPNEPVKINEEPLRKYQDAFIEFFERDHDLSETFPMAVKVKQPRLWTGLVTSVDNQPHPPELITWRDTPYEGIFIINNKNPEKRHAIVVSQDGIMLRPTLHSEMEYPCPQNITDIDKLSDDIPLDKDVLKNALQTISRPITRIQREQEYIDDTYCITPMTQHDDHETTLEADDILLRLAIDSRLEMGAPNKDIRLEMP